MSQNENNGMQDDRAEELKQNILSPKQWIRILYMAFYAVTCWLLTIVLTVVIIAQVLISLITGRDNENLRTVGTRVATYFHELLKYLVYETNDRPWPFNEGSGFPGEEHAATTPRSSESVEDEPAESQVLPDPEEPAVDTTAESTGNAGTPTPGETEDDVFRDISFTEGTGEIEETNESESSDDKEKPGSDLQNN